MKAIMKNTIIKISAAFALLFSAAGCGEWTEIEPKGTNMLQKVSDIDLLLNYQFSGNNFLFRNGVIMVNDVYPGVYEPIYPVISNPANNPVRTAIFTWDEGIDRKGATETDAIYTAYYGIIGKVCNPVILRADAAEGDGALAMRYKAEAYILRAYYHYLLVNIYAKAYDPATAAQDGGIPYSRETDLLSTPNEKRTVQDVYKLILEDLDAAFALNSLASPGTNRMRVNTAFAHAVRAKVLMSMRDYDGAYQAATASLGIENTIDNYNTSIRYNPEKTVVGIDMSKLPEIVYIYEGGWEITRPVMSSSEDLFYTDGETLLWWALPPEFKAWIEPGNIFFRHVGQGKGASVSAALGVDVTVLTDMKVSLNPGGLSTIDMYLIQAECLIRKGDAANITAGMDIINMIRRHRVATDEYAAADSDATDIIDPVDYYAPYAASTLAEAIAYLKRVDRAESWYGPKRFINVKRWNTEDSWKETLVKHVECITSSGTESFDYTVTPDSPLWIFPFPAKSTELNHNLTQNY